jgi:hypothetical protein
VTREAAWLRDTDRVRALLGERIDALAALARSDSTGVECLFAGLFASTLKRLVEPLDRLEQADFAYLTVLRFFDLYDLYVARPEPGGPAAPAVPAAWRRYRALVRRLDMTSPIAAHLWLISLGTRAHTRHDLAEAIGLAAADYRRAHGREPDFAAARAALLGPHTGRAFYAAARDFIDLHRRQRRGWRRWVLAFDAAALRVTRPLWLGIYQAWRRAAWNEAMARLPALAAPHREEWPLRQPPPSHGWPPSP